MTSLNDLRRLGRSPVTVPPIGLGTWGLSGAWWGPQCDTESIRTIERSLDLGVTLIDTAESYGGGHAEEILGSVLARRRDEAVVMTKVAPEHFDSIEAHFEASCRRLRTDVIDVYLLHWPHPSLPLAPAVAVLERLREAGRIRAIGVSNFAPDELEAAQQHGHIDVVQVPYNMFWRQIENVTLPYCRENDIAVIAYSGLAQGLLTGLLGHDTMLSPDDNRRLTVLFQTEHYDDCITAAERLRTIAARNGCSVAHLAIHWLTSRPGCTAALLGARTAAEAEDNARAVRVELNDEDRATADAITRAVWQSLPPYPDMFRAWARIELQKQRHQRRHG
jgi:myo-inositol catabolism protein IolS